MIWESLSTFFFRSTIALLIAVLCLSCDRAIAELTTFDSQIEVACEQRDSARIDSLVSSKPYASYRYNREMLERYDDSGDSVLVRRVEQVAAAINRALGDGFYLRQVSKYRYWQEKLRPRRSELRQKFAELASQIGVRANDSLAVEFARLSEQYLDLHDSAMAVRTLQYSGTLTQRSFEQPVAPVLQRSLDIARAIGDRDGTARSLNLIGSAYQSSGYSWRAGSYFDSARVIRTGLQDERGLAECYINISTVYFSLDQLSESYRFAVEALRMRRQLADSALIAQSLLNMISAFRQYRPLEEISTWLEEARLLGAGSDDLTLRSRLLQAAGITAEENGAIDSAELYYDSSLVLAKDVGNVRLQVSLLTAAGSLKASQNEFEDALTDYSQAAELAEKAADRAGLASAFHNIGVIQQRVGDLDAAIRYFKRSLDLRRSLLLPNEMVETLCSLGEIYCAVNDLTAAREYLHEAIRIAQEFDNRRLLARAWVATAQVEQREGDAQATSTLLDSALAVYHAFSDQQRIFEVQLVYADLARLAGEFASASHRLKLAAGLLESRSTYGNLQRYDIVAGLLAYDQKLYDTALATLTRVVGRLERTRREIPDPSLRAFQKSSNRYLYERLVSILALKYRRSQSAALLDSLVQYIELAKSSSVEGKLPLANKGVSAARSNSQRQTARLMARIERLEKTLANEVSVAKRTSLLSQVSQLEDTLADLRLRNSLSDSKPVRQLHPSKWNLASITAFLAKDEAALLDYLLTPEGSYLLVITGRECSIHVLPSRVELTRRFADYTSILQRSARDESLLDSLKLSATALGNLVFGSSASKILANERLYIATDAVLTLLPFESLMLNGKYLIERVEVVLLPSLRRLREATESAQRTAPKVLIIADPSPNAELRSLPYSQKEAEWIAKQFPTDACRVLSGKEAVRSVLMSPELRDYSVIHFATHSTVDRDDPLRSRLWLSPDTATGSTEYLTLADITQLAITADLVVLSSCESGGGRFQLSEGIEGFVQGFLRSGCRRVVVSLWDVEDYASAVFMREFYGNLSDGYARALRKAKLSMLDSPRLRLRHPYYWASFVLTVD